MAVDNPWSEEFWNLTAQGAYISLYGLSVAQKKAREAGSFVGAVRPKIASPTKTIERHWIIQKGGGGSNSSTPGNRGYTGDGPPGEEV
jgi:hypothetical protein